MTPDLAVQIDLSDAHITGKGRNLVGRLWLEYGQWCFPSQQWSDFPVAVMSSWIVDIGKLKLEAVDEVDLYFMDGPYSITVRRVPGCDDTSTEGMRATLEFKRDGDTVKTVATCVDTLLRSVAQAASHAVMTCDVRGWKPRDLEAVRLLLSPHTPE